MPEHFLNHNCDLNKLEKLEIIIWGDFDSVNSPTEMRHDWKFTTSSLTTWKADSRDEQTLETSENMLFTKNFLERRIPEIE